jgi:hypothetical protein
MQQERMRNQEIVRLETQQVAGDADTKKPAK